MRIIRTLGIIDCMKVDSSELIKNGKLPADELDEFWAKFFGAIPTGMLFLGSLSSFFARTTEHSVSFEHKLVFFSVSTILFGLTLWFFYVERNLKQIHTGLSKEQNLKVFQSAIKLLNWRTSKKISDYHKLVEIPFAFGHPGHKLTVLIDEQTIYFNLRNVGTPKGRMPYLLGIDSFKEFQFKRAIRNYAQQNV